MNAHLNSNRIGDAKTSAKKRLLHAGMSHAESEVQVKMLFEYLFGFSSAELVMNHNMHLSESDLLKLHKALNRMEQHEPIQYVLGEVYFFGLNFKVTSHVLIPRPETEELVHWILQCESASELSLLDIGTGSGIIPISIKKNRSSWTCTGLDVSIEALQIAEENASRNQVQTTWLEGDALEDAPLPRADVWVSNPPYIPNSEGASMEKRVTQYEPELALFVADSDPLIFYRIILNKAMGMQPTPIVYFEMHENYADQVQSLAKELLFETELKLDSQYKKRMLRCWKVLY
ncbi:MAG: peptide chain release factor N(5)-glutamine methyltransferase [Bacteroidota bacterium]